MAQGAALALPEYVTRLENELKRKLPRAKVGHEQVRRDRYRFMVVWSGFDGRGHPERQEMVWNIADEVVPKKDLLKVAMIITLGAKE
jgi:hypothetical protein